MNEAIRSGKVVQIGDRVVGSVRNAPNPAFFGRVDYNGSEIEVILKIEPSHRLAKELIATSLASRVGIQHAPGLIGIIDSGDLNQFGDVQPIEIDGSYLCFASEKRLGSALKAPCDNFHLSEFALELLVFDQLIGNFDRVYENILEHEGCYWAFDHDKILFCDANLWSGWDASKTNINDLVGMNISFLQSRNLSRALKISAEFNTKISNTPLNFLSEIAKAGLFKDEDATALTTYLNERAANLPAIVEKFIKTNSAD
ncbi:hypothetical protein [Novosphingobium sp. SG707]|uniref:hypothetical protein n=1 Tax=Novosphingobium sp. SG707 TaxID=2586996 RepID=UPI001833DBA9|nr:hypothetical protein [Novosphingobium sp. SG707]NKJ02649.1 hypothetical protein [Novosphingobium sp. SG707]